MTPTATAPTDVLRVDNIGSLLRPPALLEAFAARAAGTCSDAELTERQDQAITEVIRTQVEHGLPVVTDGEFRREHYMQGFADISGFRTGTGAPIVVSTPVAAAARGSGTRKRNTARLALDERMRLVTNRPRAEFEFAQARTSRPVKATLINPDGVAQRFDSDATAPEVYPDVTAFIDDVVAVSRELIAGLVEAGCRYIQIDAPRYAVYVDENGRADLRSRGRDPARALEQAIAAENALIAGFSDDVVFGLHICRGNGPQWQYEGSLDEVFSAGEFDHHRLLLEFDSDRDGGFEQLARVPDHAVVVLGLITTKSGELESADDIRRRIEEASRYVPLDRLALSTQCGFASLMDGNPLSEDAQWRKLDLALSVADEVWGR